MGVITSFLCQGPGLPLSPLSHSYRKLELCCLDFCKVAKEITQGMCLDLALEKSLTMPSSETPEFELNPNSQKDCKI